MSSSSVVRGWAQLEQCPLIPAPVTFSSSSTMEWVVGHSPRIWPSSSGDLQ
jgi:hypothetical protein